MATLILLRHGQSVYNEKNLFTGWTDVDLSRRGEHEAQKAGKILLENELFPDICFTSWLKRSIHTAQLLLKTLYWEHIDCIKSWKLNERHYGQWQERNKNEIEREVGKNRFLAIRRGYDMPPPPLEDSDPRCVKNDPKYRRIDPLLLPKSESLKDTKKRTLSYYFDNILPKLADDKTVLVSAHGNSLRALIMSIESLNKKEILKVEVPTAKPIVYQFDKKHTIYHKIELTQERIS